VLSNELLIVGFVLDSFLYFGYNITSQLHRTAQMVATETTLHAPLHHRALSFQFILNRDEPFDGVDTNMHGVGPTAHLAFLDIFLLLPRREINENFVDLEAPGTAKYFPH